MITRRVREVVDTVLIITSSYELGFRRFNYLREQNEKIYNSHSINLNGATRNTTRLRLFCFTLRDQSINWLDRLTPKSPSSWSLNLWLQVQIFYDHVNYTTQMAIDYAAGGRLRKLRPKEAWETIENLAQSEEEEEWNEPIFSEKGSPDYIDANLEQELESMERRVESLMRSEVLLYYEEGFMSPKRPYQEEFER
ncbi:hypothetical protein Tco_0845496 [Tanacetum coccineum]